MAQAEHFLNFKVRRRTQKCLTQRCHTHQRRITHLVCCRDGQSSQITVAEMVGFTGWVLQNGCSSEVWHVWTLKMKKLARKTHTSPVCVAPQSQKYACKWDHIELPSRNTHFCSKVVVSCSMSGDVTSQPTPLHLMSLICNSSVSLISPLYLSLPFLQFNFRLTVLDCGGEKKNVSLN